MTDLATTAITAYTDGQLIQAEQAKTAAEDADRMAVVYAFEFAVKLLGDAAEELAFEPEEHDDLAAEADLPGSPGYGIRYVYSDTDETGRLFLVRPCAHCGHVAVDEIRSLPHLGDLLSDGPTT